MRRSFSQAQNGSHPEAELQASTQQILERGPDLLSAIQTVLLERLPLLTREELMEIATIPAQDLRHTRVAQEWIDRVPVTASHGRPGNGWPPGSTSDPG